MHVKYYGLYNVDAAETRSIIRVWKNKKNTQSPTGNVKVIVARS